MNLRINPKLLILILLINSATLYCMQPYTLLQKRAAAQEILSIANQSRDLRLINEKFKQENTETTSWFECHTAKLQNQLRKEFNQDLSVKIMGSRRWNTNHILSDIDAVIVTNSINLDNLLLALGKYYETQYKDVKQFSTKTKAGLYLFVLKNFADKELGEMKLEYTFQTPEVNQSIIEGMEDKLPTKFKTQEEKTLYALEMMEAVYNENAEKQTQLKEWTRILATK